MTDQQRANQLAKIVNAASKDMTAEEIFENSAVIKTKFSQSKWYEGLEGSRHEQSMYETRVLKSVADEAKELQNIRKSHQNDFDFDFQDCDYTKVIYRMADHENFEHTALDLELQVGLTKAEYETKQQAIFDKIEKQEEESKRIVAELEQKAAEELAQQEIEIQKFVAETNGKNVYFTNRGMGKIIEMSYHKAFKGGFTSTATVQFEDGIKEFDQAAILSGLKKAKKMND